MKDAFGHGSNAHNEGIEKLPRKPKPLSGMPRAALLKAYEKAQAESTEINRALIDMGHGQSKPAEIRAMTGHPIYERYARNADRVQELYMEREARKRYQGNEHPIKKSKWL